MFRTKHVLPVTLMNTVTLWWLKYIYTSLHNDHVVPVFFKGNEDSASNLLIFNVSHCWYFIGCSIAM